MTTRFTLRAGALAATSLLTATLLTTTAVRAAGPDQATPNNALMGADIYRMYCASCHGVTARGDGPLAASMRRTPPNLTEITKRHKGAYPKELIFKIIDGRERVPGHGGPDMPVWGDAFMRTSDGATRSTVQFRIQALVDFLETLQARDTQ
jgi:mono/diheme cytochrome c family protein